MKNQVLEIVSSITKKDETYINENMNECIWDSLQRVEIILSVEEEFDIMFEEEEVADINSVNKLIKYIEEKA